MWYIRLILWSVNLTHTQVVLQEYHSTTKQLINYEGLTISMDYTDFQSLTCMIEKLIVQTFRYLCINSSNKVKETHSLHRYYLRVTPRTASTGSRSTLTNAQSRPRTPSTNTSFPLLAFLAFGLERNAGLVDPNDGDESESVLYGDVCAEKL